MFRMAVRWQDHAARPLQRAGHQVDAPMVDSLEHGLSSAFFAGVGRPPDLCHDRLAPLGIRERRLGAWPHDRFRRDGAGELHGRLDKALLSGGFALGIVAFVAVVREGLETALFLWAATSASEGTAAALGGALLGILTAVVIGWLVYRGAVRMNLATFFTWTGAALIVVAAGVLAYGVRDLQEAGWLPGGESYAFDLSGTIDEDGPLGTVLGGFLHFDPITTWLQAIVWVVYLVVTLTIYFRPQRPAKPVQADTAAPTLVSPPSA